LKLFQSGIQGTATPGPGSPPSGLLGFYWHFVRQTKGWYAAMFAASLVVALLDTVIPLFIGRLVSLMGRRTGRRRSRTTGRSSPAW
jgi:ATP-binding cassette subfamily B multidrug efflux pump